MRTRGVASVEFALVMTVLVPLVLGAVEFGRAVAVGTPADAARQLEARCIVVTGAPETAGGGCARPALLAGLTVQQVAILEPASSPSVRAVATGAGTLDLVTVTVSGWRFPALGWSVLPAFSFSPISVTVPYVFF
jgi:hypothetical protein